jgi:hypothetical protein
MAWAADGVYRSPALAGLPLSVAWLWQRLLPNPAGRRSREL